MKKNGKQESRKAKEGRKTTAYREEGNLLPT